MRQAALGFADLGMNTRVCVQGSMGQGAFTGVPRVLSGVRKLLSMMDWQAGPGEAHEGVLGEEEAYTRRSKGVGEGEGFRAWRKLSDDFEPDTGGRHAGVLIGLMGAEFGKSGDIVTELESFETAANRWE